MSSSSESKTIRVLGLHGSGGNASEFADILGRWKDFFAKSNEGLEITTLNAPVLKEGTDGFAWWGMPPNARSYNAAEYYSFDTSEELVVQALSSTKTTPDLVVAHSQGAILIAALLALGKISRHPPMGYILNGIAWPNPYGEQLESIDFKDEASTPRFLFIMGEKDTINPPEQAIRIANILEKAGCSVTRISHPGGHSLPTAQDEKLEFIHNWIIE